MNTVYELKAARALKRDEFYTRLCDIEDELEHYKEFFKGKVVYCNCDDALSSNFVKYFKSNFKELGLSKLIATSRTTVVDSLFDSSDVSIGTEYCGKYLRKFVLQGNGDFRSSEALDLLCSSDIVVTNPPFSLWEDHMKLLLHYGKDFLVIGHINAVSFWDVFRGICRGEIQYGFSVGNLYFNVPDSYDVSNASRKTMGVDGKWEVEVKGTRWFTNLPISVERRRLELTKCYDPEIHKEYDNFPSVINVDSIRDIPKDYDGIMGVPISLFDKDYGECFDIVGTTKGLSKYRRRYTTGMINDYGVTNSAAVIKEGDKYKAKYARVLIKRKD